MLDDDDDYCYECHNQGWVNDDLSHACGGRWWKYCDCKAGDRLSKEDDEEYRERERQNPYKTCDACGGSGKVKKKKKEEEKDHNDCKRNT